MSGEAALGNANVVCLLARQVLCFNQTVVCMGAALTMQCIFMSPSYSTEKLLR